MTERGPVADEIEGVPLPSSSIGVEGHKQTIEKFLARFRSGRMHHAYLLTGPKGIGKSTLALRLGSHLFRYQNPSESPLELHPVDPKDPIDAKIAARSHPNLLHLQRPWDLERKRFKQNLTIDEIRKTIPFFGTSKGEAGWRVGIVDAADDMNRSASNALLKILEEPPEKTVFFVLSHSPAKVMPTIRSRCQQIVMKPLQNDDMLRILEIFDVISELSDKDKKLLLSLAAGSVRDGITLVKEDGLDLYRRFSTQCNQLGDPDWSSVHALADMVTGRGAENRFKLLFGFAEKYMEMRATGRDNTEDKISVLARWAEVWEKTRNSVRTADSYNLDRKQLVLNLFYDMGEAARA